MRRFLLGGSTSGSEGVCFHFHAHGNGLAKVFDLLWFPWVPGRRVVMSWMASWLLALFAWVVFLPASCFLLLLSGGPIALGLACSLAFCSRRAGYRLTY